MRETLITVAIEKFGQKGFEGVGTREIAAAADTAMSSIRYHFGGKEGLYEAAASYILSRAHRLIAGDEQRLPRPDLPRPEQVDCLIDFLLRAARMMLRKESAGFALFMARLQQSPSPENMAMLRRNMMPMMDGYLAQVRLLKPGLSEQDVRATAFFLFSMTVSLRHSRAALGILLDRDEPSDDDAALLLGRLEAIARAILAEEDK